MNKIVIDFFIFSEWEYLQKVHCIHTISYSIIDGWVGAEKKVCGEKF